MKRKGFTFVELLILVVVVAILASILFPVFDQARAKAKKKTCLNNLKMIALACLMYAEDNDNYLPIGWHFGAGPNGLPNANAYDGWPMCSSLAPAVLPYLGGDVYVFHCPQDPGLPNNYSYPVADPAGAGPGPVLGWSSWDETSGSLDYIDNPKKTILLACAPHNEAFTPWGTRHALVDWSQLPQDSYGYTKYPGEFFPGNVFDPYHAGFDMSWGSLMLVDPTAFEYTNEEGESWMLQVHKGGTNYGYCDGSAKWHKLKQTLKPRNQWTRDGSD